MKSGGLLKATAAVAVAVSLVAVLSAASQNEVAPSDDIAHVGEIRMSLLAPAQFREFYGTDWVLMDGKTELAGTDLAMWATGIHNGTLPDARGAFLRGMNEGRDSATGDIDTNRRVGSYQSDAFQTHKHKFTSRHGTLDGGSFGLNARGNDMKGWSIDTETPSTGRHSAETRPKNIAVYIYVKVRK